MNRRMVDAALDTLREVDVVVLVIDATARPGSGDEFVLRLLERVHAPAILALNKVDVVHKPRLLPLMDHYAKAHAFRAVVPISARTGSGVPALQQEILAALPDGLPLYDQDYLTDQTERSLAAELIREQVLAETHDELPFTTAVAIDQFEEPSGPKGVTRLFASILVDQESHKAMVIGKGGEKIKRIGINARRELERMLGGQVYLDLHVKVRADWRDDDRLLNELGLGRK